MTLHHGDSKRTRQGPANPNYRAGKSLDANGYVTLTSKAHGQGYGRREHRVVAEAMLGRSLLRSEVVHHLNHDKADNRPENLVVLPRSEHQRVHLGKGREIPCRVCGCAKWHSPAAEARIGDRGYACRSCGGRYA